MLHMEGYPQEGALRGGHIPGARNIPWATRRQRGRHVQVGRRAGGIYEGEWASSRTTTSIAYCRIGERSSHTWFVLTYLLGYPNVRNYDGSWTEWGSLVRVPIEKNV